MLAVPTLSPTCSPDSKQTHLNPQFNAHSRTDSETHRHVSSDASTGTRTRRASANLCFGHPTSTSTDCEASQTAKTIVSTAGGNVHARTHAHAHAHTRTHAHTHTRTHAYKHTRNKLTSGRAPRAALSVATNTFCLPLASKYVAQITQGSWSWNSAASPGFHVVEMAIFFSLLLPAWPASLLGAAFASGTAASTLRTAAMRSDAPPPSSPFDRACLNNDGSDLSKCSEGEP